MGHTKAMSPQMKVKILHRIWAGEKVARVARECRISRQVIYTWKRKADRAISQALQEKKRGPKAQHRGKVEGEGSPPRAFSLEHGSGLPLHGHNTGVDLAAATVPKAETRQDRERPERCPVCGCEKIYRNGTYTVKNRSTAHGQQHRKVQRYICVWCKSSICVH